jgi:hypothetical protein
MHYPFVLEMGNYPLKCRLKCFLQDSGFAQHCCPSMMVLGHGWNAGRSSLGAAGKAEPGRKDV